MKSSWISRVCGLALAAGLVIGSAQASPILGLFNTGVDNAGVALGSNQVDPHYTIVNPITAPAVTVTTPDPTWVPNNLAVDAGPDYRWIWQNATGQPTGVTRTFRTTFVLTDLDPSTAMIAGKWATDNSGNILLNGAATGQTCGGFGAFCNFSINSGFVAGVNTLDFVVTDVGVIAGFLVGAISGTAAPEPGTLVLLAGALLTFTWSRRRRALAPARS